MDSLVVSDSSGLVSSLVGLVLLVGLVDLEHLGELALVVLENSIEVLVSGGLLEDGSDLELEVALELGVDRAETSEVVVVVEVLLGHVSDLEDGIALVGVVEVDSLSVRGASEVGINNLGAPPSAGVDELIDGLLNSGGLAGEGVHKWLVLEVDGQGGLVVDGDLLSSGSEGTDGLGRRRRRRGKVALVDFVGHSIQLLVVGNELSNSLVLSL